LKDSYKKIVTLSEDDVRPFLDEKKVLMSYLYSQALAHGIEHSENHGDYRLLGALVNVFESREFKLFVSGWICERLGLKSRMGPVGAVFTRSGNPPNTRMSFKVSLEEFAGAKFKAKVPIKPASSKIKKKTPKRIDMLDSWARLPGSFGHGKR
jgi:hypothetical protein